MPPIRVASVPARASLYIRPDVSGLPWPSVSSSVPDVPSTEICWMAALWTSSLPMVSTTAFHQRSGAWSIASPSWRGAGSAVVAMPTIRASPSIAQARTPPVPISMPRKRSCAMRSVAQARARDRFAAQPGGEARALIRLQVQPVLGAAIEDIIRIDRPFGALQEGRLALVEQPAEMAAEIGEAVRVLQQ